MAPSLQQPQGVGADTPRSPRRGHQLAVGAGLVDSGGQVQAMGHPIQRHLRHSAGDAAAAGAAVGQPGTAIRSKDQPWAHRAAGPGSAAHGVAFLKRAWSCGPEQGRRVAAVRVDAPAQDGLIAPAQQCVLRNRLSFRVPSWSLRSGNTRLRVSTSRCSACRGQSGAEGQRQQSSPWASSKIRLQALGSVPPSGRCSVGRCRFTAAGSPLGGRIRTPAAGPGSRRRES